MIVRNQYCGWLAQWVLLPERSHDLLASRTELKDYPCNADVRIQVALFRSRAEQGFRRAESRQLNVTFVITISLFLRNLVIEIKFAAALWAA